VPYGNAQADRTIQFFTDKELDEGPEQRIFLVQICTLISLESGRYVVTENSPAPPYWGNGYIRILTGL
jgi:hypothetical protein